MTVWYEGNKTKTKAITWLLLLAYVVGTLFMCLLILVAMPLLLLMVFLPGELSFYSACKKLKENIV